MASNYLKEFQGVIGKTQSKQIVKLLNKQRNTGQIQTLDEFATRMESLIRDLTETNLAPTLKRFHADIEELTSQEQFNFMLDRVEDDLHAAFLEALNIDKVQTAHEAVIRDLVLKNLRAAVSELESRVSTYEFFNGDTRGFSKALFSTFKESKEERTTRGNKHLIQFVDPRTGQLIPNTNDAVVDLVGERLVLSNASSSFHGIQDVEQLFDAEAPQSFIIVEPPGQSLLNVIDGQKGTYWVQSILTPVQTTAAKLKLELRFATVKEVNIIELEPVAQYPVTLEAIHYADSTNTLQELIAPEIYFDSPLAIITRKIATDRIVITLRNENSRPVQFQSSESDSLLFQQQAAPPEGISANMTGVQNDLDHIIQSPGTKKILGIEQLPVTDFGGYEYILGIDNVRAGLTLYDSIATYISSPLEAALPARIGIKTVESRPYIDPSDSLIHFTEDVYNQGLLDTKQFITSIEYWVVKQDLSEDGSLVHTSRFPILPLDKTRVQHERLVLTIKSDVDNEINDIGYLNFFSNKADGSIEVYRNGILFTNIDATPADSEGWLNITAASDRIPNNATSMRFKIQIKGALVGDVFTVSYTPILSTTGAIPLDTSSELVTSGGLQVVDGVGDLSVRYLDGQVVLLDKIGKSATASKSRLFLNIIMRQNTADASLTPAVEEYLFIAGESLGEESAS